MAAPLRRALLALGPARSRLSVPVPAPARPYRADPLRRRPGPAPADPEDPRAAARRFGRLGEASGVEVWRLWPSPEQLREAEEEEREWDPPLRDVEAVLDQREREEARRRKEREELVARSLAAMPARVAAWRREREALRERARADAARRQRLLAEAGLGGLPRPGTPARASARAQELLDEMERQQRREEKRRRRQEREEAARSALAAAEAAAAARPLPGTTPEGEETTPRTPGETS
ncbi:PREDICTED: growth arrest and DNA damage-inducible proteins-interacting protein 1 [Sturnus vulgaris]|uniref:growth arrest and DNA damage-inducible proteins-interacting protein 1 n=1 Tax=Sturnus vulgaris TaxID=9172 RepID=UPI00071A57F3|nr:PREDICTED: growth arrest and DNA damage-inducible proteins-interacting protein 1 [Sturnus vulgaris]